MKTFLAACALVLVLTHPALYAQSTRASDRLTVPPSLLLRADQVIK